MSKPAQWEGATPADVQFLCIALAMTQDGFYGGAMIMLQAACAYGYITDSDLDNAHREMLNVIRPTRA